MRNGAVVASSESRERFYVTDEVVVNREGFAVFYSRGFRYAVPLANLLRLCGDVAISREQ